MMPDEVPVTVEDRILAKLAQAPQPFFLLHALMPDVPFRKLDATLQRLRRDGKIVSLPRISGVRPLAFWALRGGSAATDTPKNSSPEAPSHD